MSVCVAARAQPLLEVREVRGSLVGVANVCSLVDLAAGALRGDVSEVGDGGDVVRVSAYLRCLRFRFSLVSMYFLRSPSA